MRRYKRAITSLVILVLVGGVICQKQEEGALSADAPSTPETSVPRESSLVQKEVSEFLRKRNIKKASRSRARAKARATRIRIKRTSKTLSTTTSPGSYNVRAFKNYARSKVGVTQFTCLDYIWTQESGWNPRAQNPSSTAYGIAQFLDSTWAGTGIRKTSDPYRQIDAGIIYIKNRYGSPCSAAAAKKRKGWY